ncbi:hypothetical protein EI427_06735 [Flammeovirga pectinis]|uniref:Outer membrane protein beta-barrel domain-containing protein n=1 Tax=Flammeovirga pectinis TaxID=2494373 RepID=A0A3Q9FPM9_9BACT|nr:OmpW family outer membrane protein [Flammeovirga pectinis]AZQ61944.1 hypothetical protein EI427_06735 [Flammeovirga pectinis]
MMKKILSIVITLVGLTAGTSFAQTNIIGLSYSMAAPMGSTSDFIGENSFRGGTFDYRHFVNPNMSIGFSVGYQRFYQSKGYTTAPTPGSDGHISGENYSYIDEFPLMATFHYYFGQEGGIRPYVGGGIGAAHFEYTDQIGSIGYVSKQWHFNIAPEVGVLVPLGINTYLMSSIKYNYAAPAGGIDAQQYCSFNIGIAFDM